MAKKVIRVDWRGVTIREAIEFEKIAGMPISGVTRVATDGGDLPMDVGLALLYIFTKREDPSYTLDQALDTGLGDYDFEHVVVEEEDPTPAVEETA